MLCVPHALNTVACRVYIRWFDDILRSGFIKLLQILCAWGGWVHVSCLSCVCLLYVQRQHTHADRWTKNTCTPVRWLQFIEHAVQRVVNTRDASVCVSVCVSVYHVYGVICAKHSLFIWCRYFGALSIINKLSIVCCEYVFRWRHWCCVRCTVPYSLLSIRLFYLHN